jgi:CelD/BcsL family acetyltransferase involved in cellulose biosynthesis
MPEFHRSIVKFTFDMRRDRQTVGTILTSSPASTEPRFVAELRMAEAGGPTDSEWDQLAAHAAEPNPFFERWALQPALRHFAQASPSLLLIYREAADGGQRELTGLAPVVQTRSRGLRIRQTCVWRHPECSLGTPLIHRDWAIPTILALARQLTEAGTGRLQDVDPAGIISRTLFDEAPEQGFEITSLTRHSRAFCDTATARDADGYLDRGISHKHRKELRRQAARMSEMGEMRLEVMNDAALLDGWIDEYLKLEATGWKGAEGAALSSSRPRELFFRDLCRSAWDTGRLQLQALRIAGRAIAMKCNLLAPPGAFAFKICFDEAYAKFSPGTHLEIFNVQQLYGAVPQLRWMDSCASRRRWLVDRMWSERRGIETLLISRSRSLRAALIPLLPLVIWFRHYCGRKP